MKNCPVLHKDMKNCTVVLERLDFTRFTVNLRPQTRRDIRENNRSYAERKRSNEEKYRNMRMDGLNLLRKCIPITEKLTGPQILKNAANYIQQLLNPDFIAQDQEKLPTRPYIKETKEREREFFVKTTETL
jgi:hypothetical protein